jgi:serine O-acetyltransferase
MSWMRDTLDADWARLCSMAETPNRPRRLANHFSPRFAPVVLLRVAHALHINGWQRLAKLPSLLNFVVFGLEAPTRLSIGPGLVLMHTQGTVIGAGRMGSNITLYQQVTLGARTADFAYDHALRPTVQDGVTITAGAKVLGAVTLGTGCTVGANAVVLMDVPAFALAVGVPAYVVAHDTTPTAAP